MKLQQIKEREPVMPSTTMDLKATVTSQNANGGAQNVNITVAALRTFTFDRNVQVPWLDAPVQFSTLANEHCDIQEASCGDFDLRVALGSRLVGSV